MSRKPIILLGMYQVNDIYKLLIQNLEKQGFQVVDISYNHIAPPFKYSSLKMRLGAFWCKKVLKQKKKKEILRKKAQLRHFTKIYQEMMEKIKTYEYFDYALFLNGQIYPKYLLEQVKRKTEKLMVAYQWDGLDRFPKIWESIDIFDKVYAFDPEDNRKYRDKVIPAANFYFEVDQPTDTGNRYDFYFLGSHVPDLGRDKAISTFSKYAEKKGWKIDFTIFHVNDGSLNEHSDVYPDSIKATAEPLTFEDNIKREMQSRVLLDFKAAVHTGLSFRTIESVGYRKKLITTNAEVAKYDFYHPDNIYIWDGKTFDGMEAFLDKPYCELPPEIYQKYSFDNWLRYILDLPPYQEITLPE